MLSSRVELQPHLQICGDGTNSLQFSNNGTSTTANQGYTIQSIYQGVRFNPLYLQPSGPGISVGYTAAAPSGGAVISGNVSIGSSSNTSQMLNLTNGQLQIYDTANVARYIAIQRNSSTIAQLDTSNGGCSLVNPNGTDMYFGCNGTTWGNYRGTGLSIGNGTTGASFLVDSFCSVGSNAGNGIRTTNTNAAGYSIAAVQNDGTHALSMFLNGSTRSNDGETNRATIRNDAGDMRMQSTGGKGLYIASTTGNMTLDGALGIGVVPSGAFNISLASSNVYQTDWRGTQTNSSSYIIGFNLGYNQVPTTNSSICSQHEIYPQIGGSATGLTTYGLSIQGGQTNSFTGSITNAYSLYCANPAFGTNKYAAYFGGSVGIGTNAPDSPLEIYNASAGTIVALNSGGSLYSKLAIDFRFAGSTKFTVGMDPTNSGVYSFGIYDAGAGAMRLSIDSGGAVTVAGNFSANNVTANTWTPTITSVSGLSASTVRSGTYQRVGNVITFTFRCSITLSTSTNPVVYGFSLPVASTFTSQYDLSGVIAVTSTNNAQGAMYCSADTTNLRGQCNIQVSAAVNGNTYEHITTGQYVIK